MGFQYLTYFDPEVSAGRSFCPLDRSCRDMKKPETPGGHALSKEGSGRQTCRNDRVNSAQVKTSDSESDKGVRVLPGAGVLRLPADCLAGGKFYLVGVQSQLLRMRVERLLPTSSDTRAL